MYRMRSDLEEELCKFIKETEIMIKHRVNTLLAYDSILRTDKYNVTKETTSLLECGL